jgi:hypothetical protein
MGWCLGRAAQLETVRRSQRFAIRSDCDPQCDGPLTAQTRLMPCPGVWSGDVRGRSVDMSKNVYMLIFFLLMIASIVGVDVLFLRTHFVARLIVNIGIVVVFACFYFVFLKDL